MAKILARFWLLRFMQVIALACVVLGGIEVLQRGAQQAAYGSVLA